MSAGPESDWRREAVIYQIYPRSFADGNGDGIGDLHGITSRLGYVSALGVDAIWLSPFFVSPQADAGYDVADYCDVDPIFGTLEDFDGLLAEAHSRGLRVIVDLVPNHTSSKHAWFQGALDAAPESPERARYVFRDGRGPRCEEPPNDWTSVFGGPAWTRVPDRSNRDGQWYLHLFDAGQPDLDWRNPEVAAEFRRILRFWLDRGVDGFRVDVAHGLLKQPGLPDWNRPTGEVLDGGNHGPMWDQDDVHLVYQDWRRILDEYAPARILVAEAWVSPQERLSRYVRDDEMDQTFNFGFLTTGWDAPALRASIGSAIASNAAVGAAPTWVLSNHDVVRHASRLGASQPSAWPPILGPGHPAPDAELGARRARALTMLMLAAPGSAYLYQGEELGLPEHLSLPDETRQDPTFRRTGGTELGRDGCRVPMPWTHDAPAFGFNTTGAAWLPQPPEFGPLSADTQDGVEGSTLELYRALLARRSSSALARGPIEWNDSRPDVLDFENAGVRVVVNLGTTSVRLPEGPHSVLRSHQAAVIDGLLQPDSAVWMW